MKWFWRLTWKDEVSARSGNRWFPSSTKARIEMGFRADLIVEDKVIVEIKSVEAIAPVHKKQLLTYLRLADKRLGLLINFNVALIKDGIARVANGMED